MIQLHAQCIAFEWKVAGMQSLNLSWNGLEAMGSAALFKALADNRGLTSLNVASTRTSNSSCVHLAAALRQNTTLEQLVVNNNGLDFDAEQLLVQALTVNRTLNHLDLKVRHCPVLDSLTAAWAWATKQAGKHTGICMNVSETIAVLASGVRKRCPDNRNAV